MDRNRKVYLAKIAVILAAIPFVIWAHEYGPDAGYSGVPKEFGTCTAVGCHAGTANAAANRGSVAVNFPNGLTYTPGVKQRLSVTISDPAATQKAWGFQLTARPVSNTATMAGSFASADANTGVMCANAANPSDQLGSIVPFGQSQSCPPNKTLAYIEHSLTGYTATRGQTGSATYQFDWTPPASDVGNIVMYVAGNAANGDLTQNGDHVYTTTYTLAPAAAGGSTPAISQGGVVSGASFQSGVVPNSWVTIQGTNLSTTTNTWDKAIVNGQLPVSLDDVSVTIGGKPAYVYFVSPTQINVVAPDVGTGSMSVTVKNSAGTSSALTASSQTVAPAFFLFGKYAVATRQDFSLAVANGTISGVTTTPAKPGDVIILWGTGFGPTTPAAPVGVQVPPNLYSTAKPVTVTVGGTSAPVFGAALAPGFAGLYQVAIQIPANASDGDLPVVATIDGAQSPATTLITIKK